MKEKVYVAGPYTHTDPCVNTNRAVAIGDRLMNKGLTPFVPHLTHFRHTMIPHPYQTWLDYDIEWLKACDAVLRFDGESSGADKEVDIAIKLGIPVFFHENDLFAHFGV